jgi:hypothetical protein
MKRSKIAAVFLLFAWFHALFFLNSGFCQQAAAEEQQIAQEKKEAALQTETEEEKIIPSPKNIREGTAIYVFIGWMWLAIFVLVYILKLKIKEIDRLYRLRFFSTKKK